MSERKAEIRSELSSLRSELLALDSGAQQVEMLQAFDRLYLGYLRGEYSDDRVMEAAKEIRGRQALQESEEVLRPLATGVRQRVLTKNYEALAERLLSQERGTWDMRHVEIVQGALSHLATAGSPEQSVLALRLQKRMSESVWAYGMEMSETVQTLESEASEIRRSLLDALMEHRGDTESLEIESASRELLQEKGVEAMVERAQVQALRRQNASEYASLKAAKVYAEQTARRMNEANRQMAQNVALEAQARAMESIREASQRLVAAQYKKLGEVYRRTLASAAGKLQAQDVESLTQGIDEAFLGSEPQDSAHLIENADRARRALANVARRVPSMKGGVDEIEKIMRQTRILMELSSQEMPKLQEMDDSAREQYLDARMLYEQKRLQFEQSESYSESSEEMLKALDFAVETPVFEAQDNRTFGALYGDMQKIRQVAQSAFSGDVGLYAPKAGSEYASNVGQALSIADASTPKPAQIPTIQSRQARRTNQLLRDVRQIAYMPSVRGDMGFPMPKEAMRSGAQPLFKRVRFSQDNPEANELLPSLYRVSGLKMRENKGNSPLRKSFADLDLRGANFELVKIIENQFDPSVKGRQTDTIGGANLDTSQRRDPADDSHSEALGVISDWMESHRDTRRMAADTGSLVKTGKLSGGMLESKLRGEAVQLPKSVQEKLSPFLGFDLSNIKVYSGPIAGMAAEAMGAHAFTLGHSVFLGKDKLNFSSAEGLGLLAHELLHTSHFSSGSSVDMKEQEAEAMESRVKNAFGGGTNLALALEKDVSKKSNGEIDKRSTLDHQPKPGSVGARFAMDPEYIFDYVCDYVFDQIIDEMRMERERNGDN